MTMLLGLLVMASVPAYWVLQFRLPRAYAGGWRLATYVPLIAMVPLAAFAAFAFHAGSNLWPLLMILAAPVGLAYLGVVAAARLIFTDG